MLLLTLAGIFISYKQGLPSDYRFPLAGKHQFVRKDSADSGISAGSSSRKTSTMSSISASSISEAPEEDCIKEETPFEEPDDDLCEKITQQVYPFLF